MFVNRPFGPALPFHKRFIHIILIQITLKTAF